MAKSARTKAPAKTALPDQGILTTLVAAHISAHGKSPDDAQLVDLVATAGKIAAACSEPTEPEEEE